MTVAQATEEANETIRRLNHDGEKSLSAVNERLENVDPIPLIDEVEAETEAQAATEASRLREEIDRIEADLFDRVPREINAQAQQEAGFDLVDAEEIDDAEDARAEANEIEALSREAAEALRATADLIDEIKAELHRITDVLEGAID